MPTSGHALHAVIIHKPIELTDAIHIAKGFIKGNKHFFRETETSYRFRNIPKTKFLKNEYHSKKLNKKITLIFGLLK